LPGNDDRTGENQNRKSGEARNLQHRITLVLRSKTFKRLVVGQFQFPQGRC
jgi:hypothetical protein